MCYNFTKVTPEERKQLEEIEAALEAVSKIGLNQIKEVNGEWFEDKSKKDMFFERLKVLMG